MSAHKDDGYQVCSVLFDGNIFQHVNERIIIYLIMLQGSWGHSSLIWVFKLGCNKPRSWRSSVKLPKSVISQSKIIINISRVGRYYSIVLQEVWTNFATNLHFFRYWQNWASLHVFLSLSHFFCVNLFVSSAHFLLGWWSFSYWLVRALFGLRTLSHCLKIWTVLSMEVLSLCLGQPNIFCSAFRIRTARESTSNIIFKMSWTPKRPLRFESWTCLGPEGAVNQWEQLSRS